MRSLELLEIARRIKVVPPLFVEDRPDALSDETLLELGSHRVADLGVRWTRLVEAFRRAAKIAAPTAAAAATI